MIAHQFNTFNINNKLALPGGEPRVYKLKR